MQRPLMFRRIWRLAWPLMVTNITVPLLGMVDTAVLGHLESPHYLAATAIAAQLFTLTFWIFGFLRMGSSGLTAQAYGRGSTADQLLILLRGLVLGATLGAGLLISSALWVPLGLSLLNVPAELSEEAMAYAAVRAWGAPVTLANFALIGWLVGIQKTRLVLWLALLTNLANIVLDLVLVVGLDQRSAGVAAASVAAECLALAVGLYWVLRHIAPALGRWPWRALTELAGYRLLLRVNVDLFLRTLGILTIIAFFIARGAELGITIVAINAILFNFLLFIAHTLDGFANAMEALCGEYLGRRQWARYRLAVRSGLHLGGWTALALSVLFWLGGEALVGLLTTQSDLREAAAVYLPWIMILPLISAWCFLLDGIFIGSLLTRQMLFAVWFAALLIAWPIWYWSTPLGNHGIWLAFSASFVGRALWQASVYRHFARSLPQHAEIGDTANLSKKRPAV